MKKFTLDTNCIIDLEENRQNSQNIKQIVQAWQAGEIELAVVAISASEKQRGGIYAETYDKFKNKLAAVDLSGVRELLPKPTGTCLTGIALCGPITKINLKRSFGMRCFLEYLQDHRPRKKMCRGGGISCVMCWLRGPTLITDGTC